MKKICIKFFVLICLLTLILIPTACTPNSTNTSNDTTPLTLSNYQEYITISAKYYGIDGQWSSLFSRYNYAKVISKASVTPTSIYVKFYDCEVVVRVKGEYYYTASSKFTSDQEIKVKLSIGGTGNNSYIDDVYNSNAHDIKGKSYEVISVSGRVKVD